MPLQDNSNTNMVSPSSPEYSLSSRSLPGILKLQTLKSLAVNIDGICELALLELAFFHLHPDKGEASSIDKVKAVFKWKKCPLPSSVSIEEIAMLRGANIRNANNHLQLARDEIYECHPLLLDINGPDQYEWLVDWLIVGKGIKKRGGQLPVNNMELHPGNRKQWLSDKSMAILRHVSYCFDVSLTWLPALISTIAPFFLGRLLNEDEWPCVSTCRAHFQQLHLIDRAFRHKCLGIG